MLTKKNFFIFNIFITFIINDLDNLKTTLIRELPWEKQ